MHNLFLYMKPKVRSIHLCKPRSSSVYVYNRATELPLGYPQGHFLYLLIKDDYIMKEVTSMTECRY